MLGKNSDYAKVDAKSALMLAKTQSLRSVGGIILALAHTDDWTRSQNKS